jgi:hypothetical protein
VGKILRFLFPQLNCFYCINHGPLAAFSTLVHSAFRYAGTNLPGALAQISTTLPGAEKRGVVFINLSDDIEKVAFLEQGYCAAKGAVC